VRTIFKLKTRSTAIFAENDQRSAIPIPASATVVLVGGDLGEDAFIKIRYEGKVLFMLSEDLRNSGEPWEELHYGSLSLLDWYPWGLLSKFWSLRDTITYSRSLLTRGRSRYVRPAWDRQ
jgi:hypothetical protein